VVLDLPFDADPGRTSVVLDLPFDADPGRTSVVLDLPFDADPGRTSMIPGEMPQSELVGESLMLSAPGGDSSGPAFSGVAW
jgi:hypothetical protein